MSYLAEDDLVYLISSYMVHRVWSSNGSFVILHCGRKTDRTRLIPGAPNELPRCKQCWR